MRRFGARLMLRNVAKVWASWQEMLTEKRLLSKFMRRLLNRSAVRALAQWEHFLVKQGEGSLSHAISLSDVAVP